MARRSYSGTAIAAIIFAAMAAGVIYRYWPNEERSVRRHLSNLAEALSFPATDNEVQRIARFRALQEYFVPEVRVRVDDQEIVSREALLAGLGTVRPPPGGIVVEFRDVVVDMADDEWTATVTLTASASARDPAEKEATVDVRHAVVEMTRRPGDWMIASAEAQQEDIAPR